MQTVSDADQELRVLALAPAATREKLRRQLSPLGAKLAFAETVAELCRVTSDGDVYQVAFLPAAVPYSEWWELWGTISMLAVRPAILVYSESSSFELWSGVLDSGCYDVLVQPCSESELQDAVQRAAQSFRDRRQAESDCE